MGTITLLKLTHYKKVPCKLSPVWRDCNSMELRQNTPLLPGDLSAPAVGLAHIVTSSLARSHLQVPSSDLPADVCLSKHSFIVILIVGHNYINFGKNQTWLFSSVQKFTVFKTIFSVLKLTKIFENCKQTFYVKTAFFCLSHLSCLECQHIF